MMSREVAAAQDALMYASFAARIAPHNNNSMSLFNEFACMMSWEDIAVQDALMYASFAARIAPALGRAYYEMAAAQEAQDDHAAALANVQQARE